MIIIQEIGTAQGPRLYWLHQDPIFRILLNITAKTLNDKTERWDYGQAQKLHGIQMSNEASCVLISFRCIPIKNHMWNHPCISIWKFCTIIGSQTYKKYCIKKTSKHANHFTTDEIDNASTSAITCTCTTSYLSNCLLHMDHNHGTLSFWSTLRETAWP